MSARALPFTPVDQTVSADLRKELNFQIAHAASLGGNYVTLKIVDAMALATELAEARQDSAHLDWCERHVCAITTRDSFGVEHTWECDESRADVSFREFLDDTMRSVDDVARMDGADREVQP